MMRSQNTELVPLSDEKTSLIVDSRETKGAITQPTKSYSSASKENFVGHAKLPTMAQLPALDAPVYADIDEAPTSENAIGELFHEWLSKVVSIHIAMHSFI